MGIDDPLLEIAKNLEEAALKDEFIVNSFQCAVSSNQFGIHTEYCALKTL
ncbi:MAG: hypothetical protein R2911_33105 [Caldilineaceae bacterium]